jgi:hypothetical protein
MGLGVGLLSAIVALAQPGSSPPARNAVASGDGELGVTFPCVPHPSSQQRPQADGSSATSRGFSCSGPEFFAALEYVDMPPSEVDPQTVLDASRDGAQANNAKRGAKLVSERHIRVSGHPGRDILISASGDRITRMRLCLARDKRKTRLVVLIYVTMASRAGDPQIDAFLGSLRLKQP